MMQKSINSLHFSNGLLVFSRCISIPFMAIYLKESFSFSPTQIGIFLGMGHLFATGLNIIINVLLLEKNKNNVIITNIFISSFLFIICYITSNQYTFFILYTGIITSSFILETFSKSLVADVSTPVRRRQNFSTRFVMIHLGFAAGPFITSFFGLIGSTTSFLLSGVIYIFIGFTLPLFLLKPQRDGRHLPKFNIHSHMQTYKEGLKDKRLVYLTLGSVFNFIVYGRYAFYLSQFVVQNFEKGATIFARLIILNACLIILFQNITSHLLRKYGLIKLMALGAVFLSLGEILFACSVNTVTLFLGIVFFTIGEMIVIPTESVLVSKISPQTSSSSYFGIQSISNLGSVIGVIFSSFLLEHYGAQTMFLAIGVCPIIGAFYFNKISSQQANLNKKESSHAIS